MEIYSGIGRTLKCTEIEYYVSEHDHEKELNKSDYEDSRPFLYWFYTYNIFDDIQSIDLKITEQIRISYFKVDDDYFELYVVKTEKQELPYVIQISMDEYEKSEDLIQKDNNVIHSTLKLEVSKGFVEQNEKYYFKVIGKFNSDEKGQSVNIRWLDCQHNINNACKDINPELLN